MRKRIARHIESCPTCHDDRQRLVSPVALLGATPVFIPAPASLRERTLDGIRLTPSTGQIEPEGAEPVADSPASGQGSPIPVEPVAQQPDRRTRRVLLAIGLLAVVVAASLGLAIAWQQQKNVNIAPADIKETATQPVSAAPSETGSQTPSNPIPSPPTATTPLPVPPVAGPPSLPSHPTWESRYRLCLPSPRYPIRTGRPRICRTTPSRRATNARNRLPGSRLRRRLRSSRNGA